MPNVVTSPPRLLTRMTDLGMATEVAVRQAIKPELKAIPLLGTKGVADDRKAAGSGLPRSSLPDSFARATGQDECRLAIQLGRCAEHCPMTGVGRERNDGFGWAARNSRHYVWLPASAASDPAKSSGHRAADPKSTHSPAQVGSGAASRPRP